MRIAFHASLQVSPLVGNCRDVARVQAIQKISGLAASAP